MYCLALSISLNFLMKETKNFLLDAKYFQEAWKSRSFTRRLKQDLHVNFKSGNHVTTWVKGTFIFQILISCNPRFTMWRNLCEETHEILFLLCFALIFLFRIFWAKSFKFFTKWHLLQDTDRSFCDKQTKHTLWKQVVMINKLWTIDTFCKE